MDYLILEKGLDSVTMEFSGNMSLSYELLHNEIHIAPGHKLTDTQQSFPVWDPNESSPSYP